MAIQEYVRLETITPQQAEEYLKHMPLNRRLRQRHLAVLTEEIRAGRWQVNGETIKFNRDGYLIDGQHRLAAVVKAATAITTYVVRDLHDQMKETIDLGLKRSPEDILGLQGYANPSHMAAAARWIWRYQTGQMENYRVNPSIDILKQVIDMYPTLKESLFYGQYLRQYIPRSLGTALHCLMALSSATITEDLYRGIKEGENLTRASPVYLVRQRLINNLQHKARLPSYEIAAIMIKAFNACKEGKHIQSLRWGSAGKSYEAFPTVL